MKFAHSGMIMAAALLAGASGAHAGMGDISITIENLQTPGGLSFTPFWVAAHDGSFDTYDGGASAAGFPGLEEIAELGDAGPLRAAFASSGAGVDDVITNPASTPPVFGPGASATRLLNVGDPTLNRYFSYASMVVPSNDFFIANGNPLAHELFDSAGVFRGPLVIDIYGRDVNDAGTEENNVDVGPAFIVGADATAGNATLENVYDIFSDMATDAYLAQLVGVETPLGTLTHTFGPDDLIGRITITPAPGGVGLLGVAGIAAARRRRR